MGPSTPSLLQIVFDVRPRASATPGCPARDRSTPGTRVPYLLLLPSDVARRAGRAEVSVRAGGIVGPRQRIGTVVEVAAQAGQPQRRKRVAHHGELVGEARADRLLREP